MTGDLRYSSLPQTALLSKYSNLLSIASYVSPIWDGLGLVFNEQESEKKVKRCEIPPEVFLRYAYSISYKSVNSVDLPLGN